MFHEPEFSPMALSSCKGDVFSRLYPAKSWGLLLRENGTINMKDQAASHQLALQFYGFEYLLAVSCWIIHSASRSWFPRL